MFKFICPRCGNPGEVPFQPSNPERILCSDCHEETGGKTFDLSRSHRAPRKKHNTRVIINIVCAQCGEKAELDYAPKGVPIEKMRCKKCIIGEYGEESRWGMIQELKEREQHLRPRPMYPITCSACGQLTELPFKPDPEKTYFCKPCHDNDGVPIGPTHKEGPREKVEPNLFIRRRKVTSSKDSTKE